MSTILKTLRFYSLLHFPISSLVDPYLYFNFLFITSQFFVLNLPFFFFVLLEILLEEKAINFISTKALIVLLNDKVIHKRAGNAHSTIAN